jgi:hypothetical protein
MKSGYLSCKKVEIAWVFENRRCDSYIFLLLLLFFFLFFLHWHYISVWGLESCIYIYIYIYIFLTGINSFSTSIFHIYGPISIKFLYMIAIECSWVIVKFTKIGVMKVVPSWSRKLNFASVLERNMFMRCAQQFIELLFVPSKAAQRETNFTLGCSWIYNLPSTFVRFG